MWLPIISTCGHSTRRSRWTFFTSMLSAKVTRARQKALQRYSCPASGAGPRLCSRAACRPPARTERPLVRCGSLTAMARPRTVRRGRCMCACVSAAHSPTRRRRPLCGQGTWCAPKGSKRGGPAGNLPPLPSTPAPNPPRTHARTRTRTRSHAHTRTHCCCPRQTHDPAAPTSGRSVRGSSSFSIAGAWP